MLNRNVGHLMTNSSVLSDGSEIPEGIMMLSFPLCVLYDFKVKEFN